MGIYANYDCCGQTIRVEHPIGQDFGQVDKSFAFFRPSFKITDKNGKLYKINTAWSACCGSCGSGIDFFVQNEKGEKIARVTKEWGGFLAEGFTDADTFAVQFVSTGAWTISAEEKGLIVAAVFPMDFAFFERGTN